jgi:hypothetical protein
MLEVSISLNIDEAQFLENLLSGKLWEATSKRWVTEIDFYTPLHSKLNNAYTTLVQMHNYKEEWNND